MEKQGDISIAVIITAVIALVVLVVLVMIFTGKMGVFGQKVSQVGESELIGLRFKYSDCQPGTGAENAFLERLKSAGEDETLKDSYRSDFNRLIEDCKGRTEAECGGECIWKK